MDGPNVFSIYNPGSFRAGIASKMRAGINNLLIARHEKGASGSTFSGAYHWRLLPYFGTFIDRHIENLVTLGSPFLVIGLEYQFFIVKTEVGLCIISTKSQLSNIFQVLFLLIM